MESAEPRDTTTDTILQTSRLFVRNLAFSCTDEELAGLFRSFGEISQVGVLFCFHYLSFRGVPAKRKR